MGPNPKTRPSISAVTPAVAFCRRCLLLFACCAGISRAADLAEIVKRATTALNSDWAADAKYACIEKDEVQKGEKLTSKTFEIVMLDGSDYRFPLAIDDQPLSPDRQKAELNKLKNEVERRQREMPAVRRRRINEWKNKRDENGELLLDFPTSFTFELLREDSIDGHPAYVLSAKPKEGLVPTTRAEKVLAGMTGTAWIDRETFHPIHVECAVETPVPVYGFLATVLPGTQIEINMTPVTKSIWLINKVEMKLNVSKLRMFHSSEVTRSIYSEQRPNSQVVDELLVRANQP
jgi:hypothetical protein